MRFPQSKQDKGFTLIELLVVVVIIGILAAIAIPVFLNQRQKAVDSGLKSDLKNAATVVETYMIDNPQTAVPGGTAANGAAGSGVLTGFKSSKGNTITVTAGSAIGAYKISAKNSSSSGGDQCMKYDSALGGLQDGFSAC